MRARHAHPGRPPTDVPPSIRIPVDVAARGPGAQNGVVRILYAQAGGVGSALLPRHLDTGGTRFVLEPVGSGEACLRRVFTEAFDALLLDHPLPDRSALDLLREVRARGLEIPVVVLTRRGEEATGIEGLQLGADDYLVRRAESLARLGPMLEHVIGQRRLAEERESLATLTGALRTVGSSLDLEQVLDQSLRAARRLLRTERNLILLKASSETLVARAWQGFDPRLLQDVRFPSGTGIFERALVAREPISLAGAAARETEPLASLLTSVRAGFVIPVIANERPLGILLAATLVARPFSKADERLLRALADQTAVAIDHAQRYAEARTQGQRLATLIELTQRVAGHRPYDDLLQLIADEARRLLGASAAACRLVEGDELAMAVVAGEGNGVTGPPRLRIGEGPCGRVAATGMPLRIPDTRDAGLEPAADYVPLATQGIRSYLGVPLLVRDQVAGVLSTYATEPERFTENDTALLTGFAGQAAVAVENARLIQQLLQAERLSAVGRIVAGVAHELNNPLAVVVGTADLLRRERVDGRVAERLQNIAAQAQRAVKIVRSLLALARKRPAQWTEVHVNQLIGETLELEGYELRSARVSVVRQFGQDLPGILADPDQLQQVFTNLFLNALEAMREARGHGTLTVTTRYDRTAQRLTITIADDGPGMPPRELSRIFEPFFTTKRDDKGTGLGLAICRQIVENHRGRISVTSQPGAGATFTIELPAVVPAAPQRLPELTRAESTADAGVDVLLVEDERVVGDLLAEFLALDGHRVDRAANGREALALVRHHPYALIVSDVRMPDLDGQALYHELRAIAPDLTRRMIFVTGDVMSPETRRFLDDTGLAFLEKPFGIAEFQGLIRGVLRHGRPPAGRPIRTTP